MHDYKELHYPKWGEVLKCGPEVSDDIRNAKYVLLQPAMWTKGIFLDNDEERFWMSEEKFVMATSDSRDAIYSY